MSGALDRVGKRQAVEADLDLHDFGHAILGAILELALLDGARGIGEIGMVFAHAGAEQLEAAAGAGRFDHGGLHAGGLAELLGNGGGEGINGRGTDDADLVAGKGGRGGQRHKAGGDEKAFHV